MSNLGTDNVVVKSCKDLAKNFDIIAISCSTLYRIEETCVSLNFIELRFDQCEQVNKKKKKKKCCTSVLSRAATSSL